MNSETLFSKISILGPGLIGGSLLLACRSQGLAREIAIYARNPESLEEIRAAGIDCSLHLTPAQAVKGSSLVILCLPIGAMHTTMESALSELDSEAVVTDVGSVKAVVESSLAPLLQGRAHWIGSHPMAGRELTGFAAAKADLFDKATCIVTPTPSTTIRALQVATLFWTALGCKVVELTPHEHDQSVAEISHLPHLVAAELTQTIHLENLSLAGSGFRDTTRVASGPPEMWQEILLSNRSALGEALDLLIKRLQTTRNDLLKNDSQAIRKLLCDANTVRDHLLKR